LTKIKIAFPDGKKKEVDLSSKEGIEILRHSTSHVMAEAVSQLFPDAKFAIGPAIETGFYYDFDIPEKLTPDDLAKIEKKMREIIKKDLPFERLEMSKEDAIDIMEKEGEKFKVELLKEIPEGNVSFYRQGGFTDLCRGPHIPSTSHIKAFKLLSLAGAYWRGDESRQMLQRIYGTAFASKAELEDYLKKLEEAEKRDHRKLGKDLDLFSMHEEAGAGFIYYHPKGAMLRMVIEDFLKREHLRRGYQIVSIPHLAKADLWKRSGHMDYYRENMYVMKVDDMEYVVKPMNCPGHILIFERKTISYRDLPIRYFELGTVYRYEKSGVLHGLLRVRGFTQDDAHIFCTPDQLQDEIKSVIDFAFEMLKTFGFDYEVSLSTRPEKFVGGEENWSMATEALTTALKSRKIKYEEDPGAGVFYGPKIDIKLKDAIGRLWQGPTIQVDFNIPERFDLAYVGEDGAKHRPVMIHRVVLGSIERFLGALIEHYAGAFPTWLAPVQVSILSIADRHLEYARSVKETLMKNDVRAEVDGRREKIGLKIREAQLQKVPYMLIVGDKEAAGKTVSVRGRVKGDMGGRKVDDFTKDIVAEIKSKS
jgi:threonyl-tRNA synthetase